MKPAPAALVALLNGGDAFIMADLYTFTLQGGGVYRYSAAATPITDSATGRVFALGPKFERSRTKTVIGTEVDALDVKIYPEPTELLGAIPWLTAAWTGQLDGALLILERAVMPSWGDTSPGTVVLFSGRVSNIDASRTGLDLKCRSHLELLNIQMPRRLWQPACNHVFGDAMCQFPRASLALTVTAVAGSTPSIVQWSGAFPAIPFAQGTIIALTGANAGQQRTIGSVQSGPQVTLIMAFLSPVAPGDMFQLLPGCDHTLATCTNVFNNAAHHGGFEFIPTPENAV